MDRAMFPVARFLLTRAMLDSGTIPLRSEVARALSDEPRIVIMNEAGPVVAVRRLHSRYKPALVQSYMRKEPAL